MGTGGSAERAAMAGRLVRCGGGDLSPILEVQLPHLCLFYPPILLFSETCVRLTSSLPGPRAAQRLE